MINIVERTPRKISGVSSFFISFEFNQQIIDIIKSSGLAVYDKKMREWEVPIISLHYLVDKLVMLDDVKLELLKNSDKLNINIDWIPDFMKYPREDYVDD